MQEKNKSEQHYIKIKGHDACRANQNVMKCFGQQSPGFSVFDIKTKHLFHCCLFLQQHTEMMHYGWSQSRLVNDVLHIENILVVVSIADYTLG